jgi:hypothetical protein
MLLNHVIKISKGTLACESTTFLCKQHCCTTLAAAAVTAAQRLVSLPLLLFSPIVASTPEQCLLILCEKSNYSSLFSLAAAAVA